MAGENFGLAFAGVALVAYMSSLTSLGFTASQYALFSSLYALPDKFIGTQSGRIADADRPTHVASQRGERCRGHRAEDRR